MFRQATNWCASNKGRKLSKCKIIYLIFSIYFSIHYSTGRSQHNTDFAKTNKNEVMRIRTNFFEDFRIRKLICENEFVILNL